MLDVLEHIDLDEQFIETTVLPLLDATTSSSSVCRLTRRCSRHTTSRSATSVDTGPARSPSCSTATFVLCDGSLFTSLLPLRGVEVLLERARTTHAGPTGHEVEGIGQWHGGNLTTNGIRSVLAPTPLSADGFRAPVSRCPGCRTGQFVRSDDGAGGAVPQRGRAAEAGRHPCLG